jgi:DNA-binding winged helix-turn-helix (wHTH) protein
MQQTRHQLLSFEGFTLDLTRGCLLGRDGEEVKLRPKSFEVLCHLVENSGRLLSKELLLSTVWPDTAVTDDSLVQCLIDIRRALGDEGQRLVKTVPRRGYIFEAKVSRQPGEEVLYSEEVEGVHVKFEEETLEGEGIEALKSRARPESWSRLRPHSRATTIALSLAAVLLAAISVTLVLNRNRTDLSGSQPAPIHSIAVLPLENLSGDATQEYFADGMTELLINNLARIRALRVISRTSVCDTRERASRCRT